MITEIKIGPDVVLEFEEPFWQDGISIAASMTSSSNIPDINKKVYFTVGGPKIWGYAGIQNYSSEDTDLTKADNHVTWRLEQHDRRYWQAGFTPVIGIDHDDYRYTVELTDEQSKAISKYFL